MSNDNSVSKKLLEHLLHSSIHSLLLEIPNPSTSSTHESSTMQVLSRYKYEDDSVRDMVFELGARLVDSRDDLKKSHAMNKQNPNSSDTNTMTSLNDVRTNNVSNNTNFGASIVQQSIQHPVQQPIQQPEYLSTCPNEDCTIEACNETECDDLSMQMTKQRNVAQMPVSVYQQYVDEYTEKNIPFIIRRYKSIAWCEKIKRVLLQTNHQKVSLKEKILINDDEIAKYQAEASDFNKINHHEDIDKEINKEIKKDSDSVNQSLSDATRNEKESTYTNSSKDSTYIREEELKNKKRMVKVTVTPNGRADAIFDRSQFRPSNPLNTSFEPLFLLPEERIMPFDEFLDALQNQHAHSHTKNPLHLDTDSNQFHNQTNFYYIQTQNDNLRTDFPDILEHIDTDLDIGAKCFGEEPEAINLWMGTDGSSSSLHRDYYENLYIVVDGIKEFTLYPPFMQPYVYENEFPVGEWKETSENVWEIVKKDMKNVWCSVTPEMPYSKKKYPWFEKATPFKVRLLPGDLFYLPSMWYHQVSQCTVSESSHHVIAVNYWYPMVFGTTYHYNQMVENIGQLIRSGDLKPEMKEDIDE